MKGNPATADITEGQTGMPPQSINTSKPLITKWEQRYTSGVEQNQRWRVIVGVITQHIMTRPITGPPPPLWWSRAQPEPGNLKPNCFLCI